jgi:hypothetical protein
MRIPVFARRTNPSIDPPIVRKNLNYAKEEVAALRADWVNPLDPSRGILCREMIRSERRFQSEPEGMDPDGTTYIGAEIPGLRWVPPVRERNPLITRLLTQSVRDAAPSWDWSQEPISA